MLTSTCTRAVSIERPHHAAHYVCAPQVEPLYYVPMLWGMYILAFTYNYSLEPEPCFGLQQPLAGALLFLSVLAWGVRLFDRSL